MNRYSLEMYALEKHQNVVPEIVSRKPSVEASASRFGIFSRNMSHPIVDQTEMVRDDSMTFIYELRCDLGDIDFDEMLPLIK
jgi:hypothetical protein